MMNQFGIIGRLTKDPDLKTTSNGVDVVTFSVAVKRSFAKKGEKDTDYFDCVAWRHNATFISTYLAKGDLIGISGSLQQNIFTDKDGNKKQRVELLVSQVTSCKSKLATDFTPTDIDFDGTPFENALGEEVG